jgi:hypothetical protein
MDIFMNLANIDNVDNAGISFKPAEIEVAPFYLISLD